MSSFAAGLSEHLPCGDKTDSLGNDLRGLSTPGITTTGFNSPPEPVTADSRSLNAAQSAAKIGG